MKVQASLLLLALLTTLPGCAVGKIQVKADVEPVTNACPSLSQLKLAYYAETPPLKVALERVLLERCQVKDLISLPKDAAPDATDRPTILVNYSHGPSSTWGEVSGAVSALSFAAIPGFGKSEDTIEIFLKAKQADVAREDYNLTHSFVSWLPLAFFDPDVWFFLISGAYLDEQKRVAAYEAIFARFMADVSPRLLGADGGLSK